MQIETYTVAPFDRMIGQLKDLPDTTETRPTTLREVEPLIGAALTTIVQTVRQREKGDYVFIEQVSATGTIRIVLTPSVSGTIARQRDQLTARNRSKASRATAQARKDAGLAPAFMNAGRRKKKGSPA